eukprot:1273781-Rhodomonas_salina.1
MPCWSRTEAGGARKEGRGKRDEERGSKQGADSEAETHVYQRAHIPNCTPGRRTCAIHGRRTCAIHGRR